VNSLPQVPKMACSLEASATFRTFCTDRQTDRHTHTDRHTDTQTDREAGRQTDRQTDRQAGRQTHTHTNLRHRSKFRPMYILQIIFLMRPIRLGVLPTLLFHFMLKLKPFTSAGRRQPVRQTTSGITCYTDLCSVSHLHYSRPHKQ
jgi:hypothetical protein